MSNAIILMTVFMDICLYMLLFFLVVDMSIKEELALLYGAGAAVAAAYCLQA